MIVEVRSQIVRRAIEPRGAARGEWRERAAVIIGVRDASGATGLGEAAPLPGMSIDSIEDADRAAHELAARVPFEIATPAHATGLADRITTAPAARFAIETALLATLAQRSPTSIAALWGRTPVLELRVAPVIDDPAESRGARVVKIKTEHPARAIAFARALPGVRLRIDANRRWPREAIHELREVAAAIDYVEEPCERAHELLAQDLPCRIALDESLIDLSRDELARALASPRLAALVLKPTVLGGFARCLELAAAAHRHGVAPIVSHALEGPIGFAACIELARAIAAAAEAAPTGSMTRGGADVPVGLAPHPGLAW